MEELYFPDFTAKVILIYLVDRSPDESIVLQKASFEIQGGRIFLVGEFADGTTPNDWAAGVPTCVSWRRVEQYLVFDSLQGYFSRAAQAFNEKQVH